MGRRVYLHIGTMKSATSYIGQLCELNSDYLRDSGILWPGEALRYKGIRDLFGRTVKETDFTGCWAALRREIRQFDGDVLLANELLAAVNVHQIRRLLRALSGAEVHVVVTARDLGRVIPSHWQTTLKNGSAVRWSDFASAVCADQPQAPDGDSGAAAEPEDADDEDHDEDHDEAGYLPEPESESEPGSEGESGPDPQGRSTAARTNEWFWRRHDLAAILARWETLVPLERVSVVTVPHNGSDPEIVASRFGAVLGVGLSGLTQPEWSNASLGAHSAELLRRLNQDLARLTPAERSFGFRGALAGSLVGSRSGAEPKFALTQSQQDWVGERARTMIGQLEATGVRVEGDLTDLLPAPSPPPDCVDPADASDPDLLEAASHGLIGLVKAYTEVRMERRDVWKEFESLRADHDLLQARVERQRKRVDTLLSERSAARHVRSGGRVRSLLGRSETLRRLARRPRD